MSFIIEPKKQPELMYNLQLLSLAQALHMEVVHGMHLRRGFNALTFAREQFGFKGSRKPAALHYVLGLMEERGMDLTASLSKWREANTAK